MSNGIFGHSKFDEGCVGFSSVFLRRTSLPYAPPYLKILKALFDNGISATESTLVSPGIRQSNRQVDSNPSSARSFILKYPRCFRIL